MVCAVIVVRAARPADTAARLEVIRETLADTYTDAFVYFFFQELTLEAVVLLGAVLFIFCGVSVWGCTLLLPTAALVVWLSVWGHAVAVLNNTKATLREEMAGWVAELRSPLLPGPTNVVRVIHEHDLVEDECNKPLHKEVVGTATLCAERGGGGGAGGAGRLRALGVRRAWRARGAGGALLRAVRGRAGAAGLPALAAAVSQLQPAARTLLHTHGWQCRGTYHRALLGDALTLPMALLELQLPHA